MHVNYTCRSIQIKNTYKKQSNRRTHVGQRWIIIGTISSQRLLTQLEIRTNYDYDDYDDYGGGGGGGGEYDNFYGAVTRYMLLMVNGAL